MAKSKNASAEKIGKGVPKSGPAPANPPVNSKINKGAVPNTFFGNSRMVDTDRVGK